MSSRRFPASASSSPALVFKSAGGLKARSMNSLMAATAAAAERQRGGGEPLRGPFCHPTLRVFYGEGSELSEFRLSKKRTLPQVPPASSPPPPLPLPPLPQAVLPAMDFECECDKEGGGGGGGGEASYKSLTPSQFEEHVKTLTDGNNNHKSGSGDGNKKFREGGPAEFDIGN